MDDLLLMFAGHLRERAAHCRELARTAESVGLAEDLRTIARSYDDEAAHLATWESGFDNEYGSA